MRDWTRKLVAAALGALALRAGAVAASPPKPAGLVDVTSFGAVGDGVHDDTSAFERAAATGRDLRVPRPRVHYKITGKIKLKASIIGEDMPHIRMYGAKGSESHAMLEVIGYAGPGLVIRGLHLDGGWDGVSAEGEWSHNILIKGSRNITIEDNVLERPYGDNILLGGENYPTPSQNIIIQNNRLLAPRRCNVGIISASEVVIQKNIIKKDNNYVTSIDAEPWARTDFFRNIKIYSNEFTVPKAHVIAMSAPAASPQSGYVEIERNRGTRSGQFLVIGANINPYNTQVLVNIRSADNF